MVNWYCVVKLAVYVAGVAAIAIICAAAPPSLQPVNAYCVPAVPACGPAAMMCGPCESPSVRGAVYAAPPSRMNFKPGGLVWMVMLAAGRFNRTEIVDR